MKPVNLSPVFLIGAALFLVGCGKQTNKQTDRQEWSSPQKVAETEDSLGGHASLHKWHDTIFAWQFQRDGVATRLLLDGERKSWSKQELSVGSRNISADPLVDEDGERLLLKRNYAENDRIRFELLCIRLAEGAQMTLDNEVKWTTDKQSFLGSVPENVRLHSGSVHLGDGLANNPEIYIPFSIDAETVAGKLFYRSHFNNGVFRSADSGKTWQLETISNFQGGAPTICRTKDYLYYFALRYPLPQYGLWFSRRSLEGDSWDAPEMITKTFGHDYGNYVAAATDDAVHVCWLDGRHEKTKLSIDPYEKNYEVAYCRRKDSDSGWSKEILLSKGLLFAYWPTMSVEGDKIVIAWAGIKTAKGSHGEYAPNDIYYAMSKDGGKSWTNPFKLTDGAKDGIVSGRPQVVLLNGVIHLVYVQGKMNLKQESPGLRKLNQSPWPIYYQQRPFPE